MKRAFNCLKILTSARTNFQTLVYKYMCDTLNTEEDHSFKHKTPIWFVNTSHRLAWSLTIYYFLYQMVFLGKQHKIFNLVEKNPGGAPDSNLPYRYEDVYVLDKAV